MNPYPIILSFVTFLATILGGFVAARFRNRFGIIAAFSAGVLIAVPLFQLLPASLNLAIAVGVPFQNVLYVTALGFIFLYILERFFSVKRIWEGNRWEKCTSCERRLFGCRRTFGS